MPTPPHPAGASVAGPERPSRTRSIAWVAVAMGALLAGALLLDNGSYLFHTTLYEQSDWASNSLFVREAKHGVLLHGHYSRWDFYHPGPALFYVLAAGEAVFFDWLHVVPTPFNGQMVALNIVLTLFFSLALSILAHGLGRRGAGFVFFLPLALLFAIWHYGTMGGWVFLETWPVYPPVLVFLCFLVAAAATGAGAGAQLPLLVITGGWLVHNYVAQPLFVLPLALLAYAGLVGSGQRSLPVDGKKPGIGARLGAGWRSFPRAHLLAAGLLALFLLPLVIDALHGSQSNLHSILAHLHRQHDPPKKFLRSLCYFLTFGAYSYFTPGVTAFGRYSAAGMLAFVTLHWRAYLCWVVVLVGPPILFAAARRSGPPSEATDSVAAPPGLRRLVAWLYLMLAGALALTLRWGMIQDGEMFYINANFNYSIYYGAALILAVALAVFLHSLTVAPGGAWPRVVISAALWLGVGVAAFNGAAEFQIHDSDYPPLRDTNRIILAAAQATLVPGEVCYLDADTSWVAALTAALTLERAGYQPRVNENWHILFGQDRLITHDPADLSKPLVRWRFVPLDKDPQNRWPLSMGVGIQVLKEADLDPANGHILFAANGNSADYAVFGWWPTPVDWAWSCQRTALLEFHPQPLPDQGEAGVDMLISAWSFTAPGKTDPQHLDIEFNGTRLGRYALPILGPDTPPVRVHLRSADWRAASAQGDGRIVLRFPDAVSPKALGLGEDARELGGGFRRIDFERAKAAAPAAP